MPPTIFSGLLGTLITLSFTTTLLAEVQNLALNRPYTLDPKPNYAGCSDPNDLKQLTDGKRVHENDGSPLNIWTHRGAVGWMRQPDPIVTIDLGEIKKISGVSFSTAAGIADVDWPKGILIFTSKDGKTWKLVGDLVRLSNAETAPPASGAAVWRYRTDQLRASGRYVAIGMHPLPTEARFLFCDEIEIYAGSHKKDNYLASVPGAGTKDLRRFMAQKRFESAIEERLTKDANTVATLIGKSALPKARKKKLLGEIEAARAAIPNVDNPPLATFTTIFPLNPVHERILSTYGRYLQAEELPTLTITKEHRYKLNDLFPRAEGLKADQGEEPAIAIDLASDETRHDAFLITNASPDTQPVSFRFHFPNSKAAPSLARALKLYVVPWTDTLQQQPIAAALPEPGTDDNAFKATLPPGVSTKIWITAEGKTLKPGLYKGHLEIVAAEQVRTLACTVNVSPVKTAENRLFCGMWDYTHPDPFPGLTTKNTPQAIKLMNTHGIDVAWARRAVLPWPDHEAFDAKNQLITPLDFTGLRNWLSDRRASRRFMIFCNVSNTFGGAKIGSPEFIPRVGVWAKAIAAELKRENFAPSQVALALVDEPQSEEKDAIAIAWIRAIKDAAPELQVFQNPVWRRPDQTRLQEAITLADIICPYVIVYEEGGTPVAEYFETRRQAGQALWFYLCSGPTRLFDPSSYYRNLGWFAFSRKAQGIAWWAFGDTGGAPSSWNEYAARHDHYSPIFITPDSVTGSIYLTALHEGIQDYALLAQLAKQLPHVPDPAWANEAQQLLSEGPTQVLEQRPFRTPWTDGRETGIADEWRLKALRLLERLK